MLDPIFFAMIVTPYGEVRVSEATAKAMDAAYPGWNIPSRHGRAKEGRQKLIQVATFVTELNWAIEAECREI